MQGNLLRTDKFIFVTIGLCFFFYVAGYFFGLYGFGRMIAPVMLMSQILISKKVCPAVETQGKGYKMLAFLTGISLLACLLLNRKDLNITFNIQSGSKAYYERYRFLEVYVKENEVVLADSQSGWFIPAFAGRVVAWDHPLYFISDEAERLSARDEFFKAGASDSLRARIIRRYYVNYILIDKKKKENEILVGKIASYGSVIFQSADFILVRTTDQGDPDLATLSGYTERDKKN
jgi:hypothetical protein